MTRRDRQTRERDRQVAAYFDDLAARSDDPETARLWQDTARMMRQMDRQYWYWLRWISHPLAPCAILAGMWTWWLLGDSWGGGPVVQAFQVVYTAGMVALITAHWTNWRRSKRYRAEIAELTKKMLDDR